MSALDRRRNGPARALRWLVLVLGLVACAWFVLAIRGLRDQDKVMTFLNHHPTFSAAQARALNATVADAQFLDPDQSLNTLRALVESQAQDLPRAAAIAKSVVRAEPQNIKNWLVLEFLVGHNDPPLYRLAQARIRALAPPVKAAP